MSPPYNGDTRNRLNKLKAAHKADLADQLGFASVQAFEDAVAAEAVSFAFHEQSILVRPWDHQPTYRLSARYHNRCGAVWVAGAERIDEAAGAN